MSPLAGRNHAAAAIHTAPTADLALWAAALLTLVAVAYLISLWLKPMTLCRRCGGNGTVGGFLFSYARSWCPKCGGQKLVPRLGTRLLGLISGPARPHYR